MTHKIRRAASGALATVPTSASGRPVTLQSVAHLMMVDAGGDIEAAARKIYNYCNGLPRLAEDLGMYAARQLAQASTIADRQQARAARTSMARVSAPDGQTPTPHKFTPAIFAAQRRAMRLGLSNSNALLNDPYTIDGKTKPLRDWCGDEIRAHGERQVARAKRYTEKRLLKYLYIAWRKA